MALPEEFLDRLRAGNDIESVISPYVNLRRRGRTMVGLCPFHGEKTPSFVVYNDTQSFYCFGCGVGGDMITFVKNIENISYMEAVKMLASKAGLALPEDGYDDKAAKERKELLAANREAAVFFHKSLNSPSGAAALKYIRGRGLTDETIVEYGLGFAPDSWDSLYKHLKNLGFSDYILYKAALVSRNSKGGYFDFFRNRLIFPIIDLRGNVVAFGGRDLGDRGPKYLNSNETPVYKKSQTLFALNVAKNQKKDHLILTEGYMDTISLHQAGFKEAIATCGTSLTEEQANVMAKYGSEIILSYDSDEAGQKATARATEILKKASLSVKVLSIQGAKDPDEFIKKFGAIRFKNLLDSALTASDHQFSSLKKKYDINTEEGRVNYLNESVKFIAKIPSKLEREVYVAKVANETGVGKQVIIETVERMIKKENRKEEKVRWNSEKSSYRFMKDEVTPEKAGNLQAVSCEEKIISALMRNSDYIKEAKEKLSDTDFVSEFHKKVYAKIKDLWEKGRDITLTHFSEEFSSAEITRLAQYLADDSEMRYSSDDVNKYIEALKAGKKKTAEDIKKMSSEEYFEYMQKLIKSKTDRG